MSAGDTVGTIQITSTLGFDTKYLFPGLVPHVVASATMNHTYLSDYTGEMSYYVFRDGVKDTGLYFHLHVVGGYHTDAYNGDIVGDGMSSWVVDNLNDPSHAQLANVAFTYEDPIYGVENGGSSMGSMSMATPDALQGSFHGQPFYLHIIGNIGNDTPRGSDWGETLDGGHGADLMIGAGGSDTYHVDNKKDVVQDSSGSGDNVYTSISLTAPSGIEYLNAETTAGAINLTGNSKGNGISGNGSSNVIQGMAGNDTLAGSDGHDTLSGGDGNDSFFFTGSGSSVLTSATSDHITDFKTGHDQIWLQQASVGYLGNASPVTPFTTITSAQFYSSTSGKAHDSSDRIVYDSDGGQLYWTPGGNASSQRILIATLDHHPSLHYTDIHLI